MKTVRNILSAILPVLLLAACGPAATQPTAPAVTQEPSPSVGVAQPTEITQPAQQAGINITQAQYDEALAKWRAAGVAEYEMMAEYQAFSLYAGTLTLRVKGGEVAEIVNFERGGRAAGTPLPDPKDLKFLTVEALFEKIGEALASKPWDVSRESDIPLDYKVEFDPTLGYPTLVQITALPNPVSGAQVADVDTTTRVLSVKKLGSSDVPGIPRTGGAQPTEITQPAQQAGINITQAQYEEAFAKWRAAGIEEYEMVVGYIAFVPYAGTLTLRVKGAEVVEVVNFERGGKGVGSPLPDPNTLRFLTVEALFEHINEVLVTKPWAVGNDEGKIPFNYQVAFDPTLGYPTLLQITSLPNPISGLQITDASSTTKVLSVKNLGSSVVPGMPRVGAGPPP